VEVYAPGWERLRTTLRDTLDTAIAAHRPPADGWLDAARPDADRLLWRLRASPELAAFARTALAPLLEHDARRALALLPTLEAFLAHGGRKAETARALHLERQSLYHRLGRLEQVLGVRLDDEDARLALSLALRAHRYAAGVRRDEQRSPGAGRR
ncbi:MAG: helix-turn-helix domain-containing protein, partial [Actinomycetota bacterium]|nr:helix-turn-helix domain-containing protein [Actinomycetota bacterium]